MASRRHSTGSFAYLVIRSATTGIYTLSLHDALPILPQSRRRAAGMRMVAARIVSPPGPHHRNLAAMAESYGEPALAVLDRKSTRLNSSHPSISYAVFCLKKTTWVLGAIQQAHLQNKD